MTASFVDGPLEGTRTGGLRACPRYLRAVRDIRTGKVDALDQPNDTVEPGEECFAYELVDDTWSQVFVRPGGRFEFGEYRHVPAGDTLDLADRDRWLDLVASLKGISRAELDEIITDARKTSR